jgi:hypothetical protein
MGRIIEKRSAGREYIRQSITFEMTRRRSGKLENVVETGFGVDISPAGIGLVTDILLEEGDVLKLLFPVSVINTILPVFTEVKWSSSTDGKFRAGLRFIS